MLKIKNLSKTVKGRTILEDVSLTVNEGSIYGFIGHNGAGKTTTMRAVLGLTLFDSGKILVKDKEVTGFKGLYEKIGYLPEDPNFYEYMTAREYLSYLESFRKDGKTDLLLHKVGLGKSKHKVIAAFSRGMKQRLGMAAALIHEPSMLILDEPTSALDPSGRYELFEMIKTLRDEGKTVILSTHILDDIEKIADKIGILQSGKMVTEGTVSSVLQSYFQPVFDINLYEKPSEEQVSALMGNPWVEQVIIENQSMSLKVTDVHLAQTEMMRLLYENSIAVEGFSPRRPTLDQVFLGTVNEEVSV